MILEIPTKHKILCVQIAPDLNKYLNNRIPIHKLINELINACERKIDLYLTTISNLASVYERHKGKLTRSFPDYKLPIHHSPSQQSIPNGCELLTVASRASVASRKVYERSEFRVVFAFYQIYLGINKKLPLRIERKSDSIEFERSENQGQFFMIQAFNYF